MFLFPGANPNDTRKGISCDRKKIIRERRNGGGKPAVAASRKTAAAQMNGPIYDGSGNAPKRQ
jgi:hypothetical protein